MFWLARHGPTLVKASSHYLVAHNKMFAIRCPCQGKGLTEPLDFVYEGLSLDIPELDCTVTADATEFKFLDRVKGYLFDRGSMTLQLSRLPHIGLINIP